MKNISFLLSFIISSISISSQEINWVKTAGGNLLDNTYKSVLSSDGNIIIIGHFRNTVDFDFGEGVYNLTSNGGDKSVFILKTDREGNFIWVRQIQGTTGILANDIVIDSFDNIYLTGGYTFTVDFDPSDNTYEMTSNGGYDIYLLKLNKDGDFDWVKNYGSDNHENSFSNIILDSDNNIYLSGAFQKTIDFDPGDNIYEMTSNGADTMFITKLNSLGEFVWAKNFENDGSTNSSGNHLQSANIRSMILDSSNNILLTGYFDHTVDFDPSDEIYNLTEEYNKDDVFILKLDNEGNFMWVKHFKSDNTYSRGLNIIVDSNDYIYSTGYFSGVVDFDPNNGIFNVEANGIGDNYLLKLDSNGNFIWVKTLSSVNIRSLIYSDNKIFFGGSFEGVVDFDFSDDNEFNLTSVGSQDSYISEINLDGDFLLASAFGGNEYDSATSIIKDENETFVSGVFEGTSDFNSNGSILVQSNGNSDIYLMKITGTLNIQAETQEKTKVYPNPTKSGKINIFISDFIRDTRINIYDQNGKLILIKDIINTNICEVDLSNYSSGCYFIKIISNEKIMNYKMIKN